MKKLVFLLLLTISSFVTMDAQETIFRNFASFQYKGGTQNWDLEQLPDGRMAIANNLGLLIYDGINWELFPISNYSSVRALYYDLSSGRLYAGASNEFGYYQVNPSTFRYDYHSLSDLLTPQERNFGEIWKILPWRDKLVFQSKSHLFILDKEGKIQTYHLPYRLETMAVVDGKLMLGTRRGIELWDGKCGVLLPGASFMGDMVVRSILSYDKKLLVATQQDGILVYDGKQLLPDVSELASVYKANQVFCAELVGCKLAVGTVKAGLIVRDLQGGQTLYLNSSKGLLNNTVLSATFDKMGNIWMGLDNGLSCAMLNIPFQNLVSERFNVGTGYTSFQKGNTIYLGTNQGLYMFGLPFKQQLLYLQPTAVAGISGQIWRLVSIGEALYCCADRGIYHIQGSEALRVAGTDGTWNLLELKAHPGYLLATDYLGILILRKEGNGCKVVNRIPTDIEMSGNIMEDADGTLWMSHWQKGIYHLRLSDDLKGVTVLQLFNSGNGLYVDQNNLLCRIAGHIYVSTVDGFYRYDSRKHRLVYDIMLSQLFNTYGTALNVCETKNHDLWAQKQGFLAIAHHKGKGYVVDSTSYRSIANSLQFGLGDINPLSNGMSLACANSGFYLVYDHFKGKNVSYPLFVRKVIATNDVDSVVYRHAFRQKGEERQVVLPHSLNSIKIEFVQPEYLADDAIVYSCYLENYDVRWSQTSMTSKEYTQLGKGDYVFHVKAYNRMSGKTQEATLKIVVLPAWYETIWAYLLYLLLVGLAFYGLVRYLKYRADRQLMIERTKRKAEMMQSQNEQLQSELKHKASELASSTMNSIHHNDILQKLDEDMGLLSESVRREDRKAVVTAQINEIRSSLQSYLNDDAGWSKFEENFNVVYDDFMTKLTERFTNLKMSDRKLCAYLRMGLSSKEMASLLNMSVRSIETARYRLRKKLNLESGESLTDFIQNFNKNLNTERTEA